MSAKDPAENIRNSIAQARRDAGLPDPYITPFVAESGIRVHVDPVTGERHPLGKAALSPHANDDTAPPLAVSPLPWLSSPGAGTGGGLYSGSIITHVTHGGYPIYGREDQPATAVPPTLAFERTKTNLEAPYRRIDVAPWTKGGYNSGRGDEPRQQILSDWQAGRLSFEHFQSSLNLLNLALDAPKGFGAAAPLKPAKRMMNFPVSTTERLAGVDVGRESPATPAFPDHSQYYPEDAAREAMYTEIKAKHTAYVASRLQPQTTIDHTLDSLVGRAYSPVQPAQSGSKLTGWMFTGSDEPSDPRKAGAGPRGYERVRNTPLHAIPSVPEEERSYQAPWFAQLGMAIGRSQVASVGSYQASPPLAVLQSSITIGQRYGIQQPDTDPSQASAFVAQVATQESLTDLIRSGVQERLFNQDEIEELTHKGGGINEQALEAYAKRMLLHSNRTEKNKVDLRLTRTDAQARLNLAEQLTAHLIKSDRLDDISTKPEVKAAALVFQKSSTGRFMAGIEAMRAAPSLGVQTSDRAHEGETDTGLRDDATNDSAETMGAGTSLGAMGMAVTGESDFKNTQVRRTKEAEDEVGASYAFLSASLQRSSRGYDSHGETRIHTGWRSTEEDTSPRIVTLPMFDDDELGVPRQEKVRGYAMARRVDGQGEAIPGTEVRIPGNTTADLATFRTSNQWESLRTIPLDVIGSATMDSAVGRAMARVSEPPKPEVIHAQHADQRQAIIDANLGLPRNQRRTVPDPLSMHDARRMSRTIGTWLSQQERDITYAATGGDISEREERDVYQINGNADPSTAKSALGQGHTFLEQYEAQGGFQPDPLAIALRASSVMSSIPLNRKEDTLYAGNNGAQVSLRDVADMLTKTRAEHDTSVSGKDTSGRYIEQLYRQGDTPYEILTQNNVNAPLFEGMAAASFGEPTAVRYKDKDGKDTAAFRPTVRGAELAGLTPEEHEATTLGAIRAVWNERKDSLHPKLNRYITRALKHGAPSTTIYGLQDARQLSRAVHFEEGSGAQKHLLFNEQRDMVKDMLEEATLRATTAKGEQIAARNLTMDQVAARRLRQTSLQQRQWFDPSRPAAQQPTISETYGVRDPALAGVIHATAEGAQRAYEESYWTSRLNDVAPAEAHTQAAGQADNLRGRFTAALSGRFRTNPEEMGGFRRWEEHRRAPKQKPAHEVAIEMLVPASMAWMGEARDFIKSAQVYDSGHFDHEEYARQMHLLVGASPADARESAARIYGGGVSHAVSSYIARIGQSRSVPGIDAFDSPDQFSNYLQGRMVMGAVSRIGDVRGFKSLLDGMGEHLNIIQAFNTTKDVDNWLRGRSNEDAHLHGVGNPRGTVPERVRNTRHFLNTMGMMLDTGNVTGERIDGETIAPLTTFTGFQDDVLAGAGTTRTLRDVLNAKQARVEQMEAQRSGARAAGEKASAAYGVLTASSDYEHDFALRMAEEKRQIAEIDSAHQAWRGSLTTAPANDDDRQRVRDQATTTRKMNRRVEAKRAAIQAESRRLVAANELPKAEGSRPSFKSTVEGLGLSVDEPTDTQREMVSSLVRQSRLKDSPSYPAVRALKNFWDLQQVADTAAEAAPKPEAIEALRSEMGPVKRILDIFNNDEHKDSLATFMDASVSLMAERQRGVPIEYLPPEEGHYTKSRIRQEFKHSLAADTVSGAQTRVQQLLDLHQQFLNGPQRDGQPLLDEDLVTRVAGVMGARKDLILQSFGESRGVAQGDKGDYLYGTFFDSDTTHADRIASAINSGMGDVPDANTFQPARDAEGMYRHYHDTMAGDNPEQQAIMDANPTGLSLVQAGAGSGKTTALVGRLARIVAMNKQRPQDAAKIVVTAFAKSAAGEIQERISNQMVPEDASQIQIRTMDADALRTWKGFASLAQGRRREIGDVMDITGSMRERITGIAASEWKPAWTQETETTKTGTYTGVRDNFAPVEDEKVINAIISGVDMKLKPDNESGRKAAMAYLGANAKDFHAKMREHIVARTDEGYLGTRYLNAVGFQTDDGTWRSKVKGLSNLPEAQQDEARGKVYIGQVMAGLHTDYAQRGRGDFTFIKTAAAAILDNDEGARTFFDTKNTIGMMDEGTDTTNADRSYAITRFGRGLTVIGDQQQNVGLDYRRTFLNFVTSYREAWTRRGGKVNETLSLSTSQRQGNASVTAANAILGTAMRGNQKFGKRKGVVSYTGYDHTNGLSKEIKGQVDILQKMMEDDPQLLDKRKIGFFTPTRDAGGTANIISELNARGIKTIGADKNWEEDGRGAVIADTLHGARSRTMDAAFIIGMGEGDLNITKLKDMIPFPEAMKNAIATSKIGQLGANVLQKAFMSYVAMTRSNVTIMSGSGAPSRLIRPAFTALREFDAAEQGIDMEKVAPNFTVAEAIEKSRGADTPMDTAMVAAIGEDREKIELAARTGRESTIEKDIHKLIPADLMLQKGIGSFQEEQARRHIQEAPAGLRLLAEANKSRTRQKMPAVAMTYAQYTRTLAGDQTAIAETYARGGPDKHGGQFEAVITDGDYMHGGKAITKLATGTILNFNDAATQEPITKADQLTERTLASLGHASMDSLHAEWAKRYGAEQFGGAGLPTGFRSMQDFAYGMKPSAMFRNQFNLEAMGDTSKALLDAGVLTPPPAESAKPVGHASIPEMPAHRRRVVERDGIRYDDRSLLSGSPKDDRNPWQGALRRLFSQKGSPEFERKTDLGGIVVTSDKANYEAMMARGATGYSLDGAEWANPSFSEEQLRAVEGRNGVGRAGLVASHLATTLATGKAGVVTGTRLDAEGAIQTAQSDLMERVGSDLGAQRNVALYAPDQDMASALHTSFSYLNVAKGGKSLLHPALLNRTSSENETLSELLNGKNAQTKLVSGENNDGIGTRIFRDTDHIIAFTGPRGGAFEASRNPDPRKQQQNPLTIEDQHAARKGMKALFTQRVQEANNDPDENGQGRQVRVRAGGAQGIDLLAGDVAMEMGLPLDLMLPAKPNDWADMAKLSIADQARLRAQAEYAQGNGSLWVNNGKADREGSQVTTDLREVATGRNGMLLANQGRVADEVVTYWDGRRRGGTANTLRMASALGIPITNLRHNGTDAEGEEIAPPTAAPAYDAATMRRYLEPAANSTRITSANDPSITKLSGQDQVREAALLAKEQRSAWEKNSTPAAPPAPPQVDTPDADGATGATFTPQAEPANNVVRQAPPLTQAPAPEEDQQGGASFAPVSEKAPRRPRAPSALPKEAAAPPALPKEALTAPVALPAEAKQVPPKEIAPPVEDQRLELPAEAAAPPPPVNPELHRMKQASSMLRRAAGLVPNADTLLHGGISLVSKEEAREEAILRYGEEKAKGITLRGWNDPKTGTAFVADHFDPSGTAEATKANAGMIYTLLHETGHLATEQAKNTPKGKTFYPRVVRALLGGNSKPLPSAYTDTDNQVHEGLADLFAQGHGARDFAGNADLWMQPLPEHRASSVNEGFARAGYSFFNALGRFGAKFSKVWQVAFPGMGNQPDVAGMPGGDGRIPRRMAQTSEALMDTVRQQAPAHVSMSATVGVGAGRAHIDMSEEPPHPAAPSEGASFTPIPEKAAAAPKPPTKAPRKVASLAAPPLPTIEQAGKTGARNALAAALAAEKHAAPASPPPPDHVDTTDYSAAYDPNEPPHSAGAGSTTSPHVRGAQPPPPPDDDTAGHDPAELREKPFSGNVHMGMDDFKGFIGAAGGQKELSYFDGLANMQPSGDLSIAKFGQRAKADMRDGSRNRYDKTRYVYGTGEANVNADRKADETAHSIRSDEDAVPGLALHYDPAAGRVAASYGGDSARLMVTDENGKLHEANSVLKRLAAPIADAATAEAFKPLKGAVKGNRWTKYADEFRKMASPQQLQAMTGAQDKRRAVSADAGSGKTFVEVGTLAHLLESGVDPAQMTMMTFTSRGVDEFKSRITTFFGDDAKDIHESMNIRTIDSFAQHSVRQSDPGVMKAIMGQDFENKKYKTLGSAVYTRANDPKTGKPRQVIQDDLGHHPGDDVMMMWDLLNKEQANIDPELRKTLKARAHQEYKAGQYSGELDSVHQARYLRDQSNKIVQMGYFGAEYQEQLKLLLAKGEHIDPMHSLVAHMATKYHAEQGVKSRMGQEEASLAAYKALKAPANATGKQSLLSRIRMQFTHMFVDEAQDLTPVQHALINMASNGRGMTVAGDRKQGIYAWRGAEENFEEKFAVDEVMPLSESRRSRQGILNFVNGAFGTNTQLPKEEKASRQGGEVSYTFIGGNGPDLWVRENEQMADDLINDLYANPEKIRGDLADDAIMLSVPTKARQEHLEEILTPRLAAIGMKVKVRESAEQLDQKALNHLGMTEVPEEGTADYRAFKHIRDKVQEQYEAKRGVGLSTIHQTKAGEADWAYAGGLAGEGSGQIISSQLAKRMGKPGHESEDPEVKRDAKNQWNLGYVQSTRGRSKLRVYGSGRHESRFMGNIAERLGLTSALQDLSVARPAAAASSTPGAGTRSSAAAAPARADIPDADSFIGKAMAVAGRVLGRKAQQAPPPPPASVVGPPPPPPAVAPAAPPATSPAAARPPLPTGVLDINSADIKALQGLPGVGKVRAQAIIDHRVANGPFASPDDLGQVAGIGKATMSGLQGHVGALPPPPLPPIAAAVAHAAARAAGSAALAPLPASAATLTPLATAIAARATAAASPPAAPGAVASVQAPAPGPGISGGSTPVHVTNPADIAVKMASAVSDLIKVPLADIKKYVDALGPDKVISTAEAVGVSGRNGAFSPATQDALAARLPTLTQAALGHGSIGQVAPALSQAGYDTSTSAFSAGMSAPNVQKPVSADFGGGRSGGGGGGGGGGEAQTAFQRFNRAAHAVAALGADAMSSFETNLKIGSDYTYIATRAAQATGQTFAQIDAVATQYSGSNGGIRGLAKADVAAMQRYISSPDDIKQVGEFALLAGMDPGQAAQQTSQIAKQYGNLTAGNVSNILAVARTTGTQDEAALITGAHALGNFTATLDAQGNPTNGGERLSQNLAVTQVLGDAGYDVDRATRQIYQHMAQPDIVMARNLKIAHDAQGKAANPNVTQKDLDSSFTSETYWNYQTQTADITAQVASLPFQIQQSRVMNGLSVNGQAKFQPSPLPGSGSYADQVMHANNANLSEADITYKSQRQNLEFESRNLDRQGKMLTIQERMTHRDEQQGQLQLNQQALGISQSQQMLGFKRQEFALTKQSNQLELRSDALDLSLLKTRAQYAPEQAALSLEKSNIEYAAQIRELGFKKRELPLQQQQIAVQMEAGQTNLSMEQDNLAFRKWYDTALYGSIGSDRSYRASLAMESGQLGMSRNGGMQQDSAANQMTQQVAATPVMGLQNEQFYSGIQHQLSQLQYGRSQFRGEASYNENVQYLKKQTDMYERRMQVEDRAREFSYRQADQQLALSEKEFAIQVQLLKIQQERIAADIKDAERLIPIEERLTTIAHILDVAEIGQMPARIAIEIAKLGVKGAGIALSEATTGAQIANEQQMLDSQKGILALQQAALIDQKAYNTLAIANQTDALAKQTTDLANQQTLLDRQGTLLAGMDAQNKLMADLLVTTSEMLKNALTSRLAFQQGGIGTENGAIMNPYDFAMQWKDLIANDPSGGMAKQAEQMIGGLEQGPMQTLMRAAISGDLTEKEQAILQGMTIEAQRPVGAPSVVDGQKNTGDNNGAFDYTLWIATQKDLAITMNDTATASLDLTLKLETMKGKLGEIMGIFAGPMGQVGDVTGKVAEITTAFASVMTFLKVVSLAHVVAPAAPTLLAAAPAVVTGTAGGGAGAAVGGAAGFLGGMLLEIGIGGGLGLLAAGAGELIAGGLNGNRSLNPWSEKSLWGEVANGWSAKGLNWGDVGNAAVGVGASTAGAAWGLLGGAASWLTGGDFGKGYYDAGNAVAEAARHPVQLFQNIADNTSEFLTGADTTGKRKDPKDKGLLGGFFDSMKSGSDDAVKAWGDFWTGVGTWASDTAKAWDTAQAEASTSWDGFWAGVGTWASDTAKAWDTAQAEASTSWDGFWTGVGTWASDTAKAWDMAQAEASTSWDGFWAGVSTWATDTVKTWDTAQAEAGKSWESFWAGVGTWATDTATSWDTLKLIIGTSWESFWAGVGTWATDTATSWDTSKVIAKKSWDDFWAGLSGMFAGIDVPIKAFVDGISSFFAGAIKLVNDGLGKLGLPLIELPKKAVGERRVPEDMNVRVHRDEAILTTSEAAAFRAGLSSVGSAPSMQTLMKAMNLTFNAQDQANSVTPAATITIGDIAVAPKLQGGDTHTYTITVPITVNAEISHDTLKRIKAEMIDGIASAIEKLKKR